MMVVNRLGIMVYINLFIVVEVSLFCFTKKIFFSFKKLTSFDNLFFLFQQNQNKRIPTERVQARVPTSFL